MFDLRLLGLSPSLRGGMARYPLRWSLASIVLVVPTGFMMFAAHATEFAENTAFRLKLVADRSGGQRDSVPPDIVPVGRRLEYIGPAAGIVPRRSPLAIWLGVICCGRLIAYL